MSKYIGRNWLRVTSTIALMLGLAGCSQGLKLDVDNYQQVYFSNQMLAQSVEVSDIKTIQTDGFKSAYFKVTNLANQTQNLEYRIFWYDKTGLEINAKDDAWTQISLNALSMLEVNAISQDALAEKYRVQFRPAQTSL